MGRYSLEVLYIKLCLNMNAAFHFYVKWWLLFMTVFSHQPFCDSSADDVEAWWSNLCLVPWQGVMFFLSVAVQLSYYCSCALLGSLITQNTARREYNQVLPCYVAASGLLCFIWWWCVPCLLVLTDTTSKPWASLLLLCIGYWWPCVPWVGATMFLLCLNPLLKLAVCCYASWLVCKLLDNSINCFIYHSAAVSW